MEESFITISAARTRELIDEAIERLSARILELEFDIVERKWRTYSSSITWWDRWWNKHVPETASSQIEMKEKLELASVRQQLARATSRDLYFYLPWSELEDYMEDLIEDRDHLLSLARMAEESMKNGDSMVLLSLSDYEMIT